MMRGALGTWGDSDRPLGIGFRTRRGLQSRELGSGLVILHKKGPRRRGLGARLRKREFAHVPFALQA